MNSNEKIKKSEYHDWLRDLKLQIKTSQIKAVLAVNNQLIMLYWDLGKQIAEKQEHTKWGSGFIEQLSKDLQVEFPEMKGFSVDNLEYMKRFFCFYRPVSEQVVRKLEIPELSARQIKESAGQEIVAQIAQQLNPAENKEFIKSEQLVRKLISVPWGHHILLLKKVKNIEQALFYINKTIENNWSRSVLEYHIESNLYGRQGKAVTNFAVVLPTPQSDLANALMKDPYNFDFLQLSEKVKETDLEKALIQHITQFLPELGIGFAYMGRQFSFKIGKKDYRTDLLFYHTKLKCHIVIELKTKEFEPEFVGKLNFYINAINELVKEENDKPAIGILLCKEKDNYEVEFALKDINNPIGVSAFHYTELTDEIKAALPSEKALQNELLNFERKYEVKNDI